MCKLIYYFFKFFKFTLKEKLRFSFENRFFVSLSSVVGVKIFDVLGKISLTCVK